MKSDRDTFRLVVKSMIAAAVIALLILAALKLMNLLVLAFASVVFGTLIRALADLIGEYTPIYGRWRLYAALLVIVFVICGAGWTFGTQLHSNFSDVGNTLSNTWRATEDWVSGIPGGEQLLSAVQGSPLSGDQVLPQLSSALNSVATVLTDVVLLLFGSVFIAADPSLYRRGVVMLVPKSKRDLADAALRAAGASLRQWMVGQFFTMGFIGLTTGFALWLLGVPSAAALGLLAGLFEIIPYLGPFLAAVPILAMAASVDQQTLLLALIAMVGVQQIEGSLVTPYVHKKVVSLPPAVSIFGVVGGGILFGTIGLIFAAPLLIVTFVLVKRLYVEEALDTPMEIPGRDS